MKGVILTIAMVASYAMGLFVMFGIWERHTETTVNLKAVQCASMCAPMSSKLQAYKENVPWVCKCGDGAKFTTNWSLTSK